MGGKKRPNSVDTASDSPLVLEHDDLSVIEQAKNLLQPIKEKYNIKFSDITQFLEQELSLPIVIFNEKLTVLESVVKYLREDKQLNLGQIAERVNRDERNLWNIYDKAKKKHPQRFDLKTTHYWIPLSVLTTSLSAQEAIVTYLKEVAGLTYHEIGELLQRNDRTIWTVYNRARGKNESK